MTDADRLELLEVKIAHLERGLQELSDAVVRQQQDIARALARNELLTRRLAALQAGAEGPGEAVEVPPHY